MSDGKYEDQAGVGALIRRLERSRERAAAAASSGEIPAFAFDRYPTSGTLSGTATVLTLRFAAISESVHVYLNGLQLDEGVDYTHVANSITLASGLAQAGDVITVRYAYLAGTTAGTTGGSTSTAIPRFGIASNKVALASDFVDGICHLPTGSVTSAKVTFHAAGSWNLGVALWVAPSTFLYATAISTGLLRIMKIDDSGGPILSYVLAEVGFSAGTDFTLECRKTGSLVQAYVNGALELGQTLTGGDVAEFADPTAVGFCVVGSIGSTADNLYADGVLVDDFDRPDSPTLGQSSSGAYWIDAQ